MKWKQIRVPFCSNINKLTKDPDERQDLIQVVQYHRSVVGDDKKSSIQASFHDFEV